LKRNYLPAYEEDVSPCAPAFEHRASAQKTLATFPTQLYDS
jgi:hypothetical protein